MNDIENVLQLFGDDIEKRYENIEKQSSLQTNEIIREIDEVIIEE